MGQIDLQLHRPRIEVTHLLLFILNLASSLYLLQCRLTISPTFLPYFLTLLVGCVILADATAPAGSIEVSLPTIFYASTPTVLPTSKAAFTALSGALTPAAVGG